MPGPVAALAIASILIGLAEAGILAILAQSALLLINHASRVHLSLGSLRFHPSLGTLLALGVGLALLRLALAVVIALVPAWINTTTQTRLRSELFAAFTCASWELQSRDREGHLQELLTSHVNQATQSYTVAAQLLVAALTLLVLVITALALNPLAALGILVVAVGLAVLLRPLGTMGNRRAQEISRGWLAYAGGVNEAVRLAEEAHVFGAQAAQRDRLDELVRAFRRPTLQTQWLAFFVSGAYQGLIYLLLLLGLVGLDALGTGHVATLGAVVLLLVRSGAYGQMIQLAMQNLRQFQPYVDRLREAERRYGASAPIVGRRSLETIGTLTHPGSIATRFKLFRTHETVGTTHSAAAT